MLFNQLLQFCFKIISNGRILDATCDSNDFFLFSLLKSLAFLFEVDLLKTSEKLFLKLKIYFLKLFA